MLIRDGVPHPHMPTRRAVDAVFYSAMIACRVGAILAFIMWAAVRLFGWTAINVGDDDGNGDDARDQTD
jgi:hypothetical protein